MTYKQSAKWVCNLDSSIAEISTKISGSMTAGEPFVRGYSADH